MAGGRSQHKRILVGFLGLLALVLALLLLVLDSGGPEPEAQPVSTSAAAVPERSPRVRQRTAEPRPEAEEPSAEERPTPDPARHVRFFVTDDGGVPVAGAHVWTAEPWKRDYVQADPTDAAGGTLTARARDFEVDYVVNATGYAVAIGERALADDDGVVHVQLVPGRRVEGSLVEWDGTPVRKRLRVLAWPIDAGLHARPEWALTDPRAVSVEADERGRFVLEDLQAATYRLVAFGDGWASGGSLAAWLMEDATRVEHSVARLFAVVVHMEDGLQPDLIVPAPIASARRGLGLSHGVWPQGQSALGTRVTGFVAGLAPQAEGGLRWTGFLTWSTGSRERIGPLRLTGSLPGYERLDAAVYAYRARSSGVTVNRVTLRRTREFGTGVGDVALSFDISALGSRVRAAALALDKAGHDDHFDIRLIPAEEREDGIDALYLHSGVAITEPAVLEGVPAGAYRVLLLPPTPARGFVLHPGMINVVGGRRSSARWRVPPVGHIRFVPPAGSRPDAQRRGGFVSLSWAAPRNPAGRSARETRFKGPPYELALVAPGLYRIHGKFEGLEFDQSLHVLADEIAIVDLGAE